MRTLRCLSASEQLAERLKGELIRCTWTGAMPGEERLCGPSNRSAWIE